VAKKAASKKAAKTAASRKALTASGGKRINTRVQKVKRVTRRKGNA
jgi:hypothetical protein